MIMFIGGVFNHTTPLMFINSIIFTILIIIRLIDGFDHFEAFPFVLYGDQLLGIDVDTLCSLNEILI